jgi:hypothetical protein
MACVVTLCMTLTLLLLLVATAAATVYTSTVNRTQVKRVDCLRACLQSGFQVQLQTNDYLREMLGVEGCGSTVSVLSVTAHKCSCHTDTIKGCTCSARTALQHSTSQRASHAVNCSDKQTLHCSHSVALLWWPAVGRQLVILGCRHTCKKHTLYTLHAPAFGHM